MGLFSHNSFTIFIFQNSKEKAELKKRLKRAGIQVISLVLNNYILLQINFKMSFGNLEK